MKLGRKEIIVESPVFLSCFRDNNNSKIPDTLNSSTDDILFLCFNFGIGNKFTWAEFKRCYGISIYF